MADPLRHKGAWAGADAGSDVWLAYSGTTYTLFGDIHRNGLRLRIVGSYGRYNCESVSPTLETTRIGANVPTGNAVIGYLWQIGPLILKPFMGASFSDQQFRPIDENNQAPGARVRRKSGRRVLVQPRKKRLRVVGSGLVAGPRNPLDPCPHSPKVWRNLSVGPKAGLNLDRQANQKICEKDIELPHPTGRLWSRRCIRTDRLASRGFVGVLCSRRQFSQRKIGIWNNQLHQTLLMPDGVLWKKGQHDIEVTGTGTSPGFLVLPDGY